MEVSEQQALPVDKRARKLATMAAWRARNPNARKEWGESNRAHVKRYESDYKAKHRVRIKKNMRAWRVKNIVSVKRNKKIWETKNRAAFVAMRNRCNKKRLIKYPHLAIKKRMSVLIQMSLHGVGRKFFRKTEDIIGCDGRFFLKWIVSQFTPGMSLENRDKWHIDHVFPVACCGKNEPRILLAHHYRNLRPLWNHENSVKWCKLDDKSIVAAVMCGIDEIHLFSPKQADESILKKAEKIGIKVFRGWL